MCFRKKVKAAGFFVFKPHEAIFRLGNYFLGQQLRYCTLDKVAASRSWVRVEFCVIGVVAQLFEGLIFVLFYGPDYDTATFICWFYYNILSFREFLRILSSAGDKFLCLRHCRLDSRMSFEISFMYRSRSGHCSASGVHVRGGLRESLSCFPMSGLSKKNSLMRMRLENSVISLWSSYSFTALFVGQNVRPCLRRSTSLGYKLCDMSTTLLQCSGCSLVALSVELCAV